MGVATFPSMCLVALVLPLWRVPLTSAVDVTCPAVTTPETHKDFQSADTCFYFFSDQGVQAAESSAKCAGFNLTIVMPKTLSQQTEIQNLLFAAHGMANSFGIGLSRISGSWTWDDGTALADTTRFQSNPGGASTFAETQNPGHLKMVQPNGYVHVMCQFPSLGGATAATAQGTETVTSQEVETQTTSSLGSTEETSVSAPVTLTDCTGKDPWSLFARDDRAPPTDDFNPILHLGAGTSKLSCAKLCSRQEACTYFRYSSLTNECAVTTRVTSPAPHGTDPCLAGFQCYRKMGGSCA